VTYVTIQICWPFNPWPRTQCQLWSQPLQSAQVAWVWVRSDGLGSDIR